jgi:4-diphosphocytidyl-2C-methyl-D-erythritol kinase
LPDAIARHVAMGSLTNPAIRCAGVSFNTSALAPADAEALMERTTVSIGLPVVPAAPMLLLTPNVSVATSEAYEWIDAARRSAGRRGAVALDLEALSGWGDIARMAGNDFESPVFGRHPEIRAAFEAMVQTRPLLCRMSGSGSTLFALYRSERDREDAESMLGRKHGTITQAATMAGVAPPSW